MKSTANPYSRAGQGQAATTAPQQHNYPSSAAAPLQSFNPPSSHHQQQFGGPFATQPYSISPPSSSTHHDGSTTLPPGPGFYSQGPITHAGAAAGYANYPQNAGYQQNLPQGSASSLPSSYNAPPPQVAPSSHHQPYQAAPHEFTQMSQQMHNLNIGAPGHGMPQQPGPIEQHTGPTMPMPGSSSGQSSAASRIDPSQIPSPVADYQRTTQYKTDVSIYSILFTHTQSLCDHQ